MMQQIPLLNRQSCILVVAALCVNLIFLYRYNPKIYFAITQAHGQIGYHLCQKNSIAMDPALTEHMNNQMRAQGTLINYDHVGDDNQWTPTESFPINDTVAYGVLLGLLWKITGSLRFIDVQLLQIMIFSLLMLFYYQLAYLLFESTHIAFVCGIAHLFFFPLIAYNVMPVRDVWAYYGLLMIAYATLAYYKRQITVSALICCTIFFALCLWMRPTLACAALLITLFFICCAYNDVAQRMRVYTIIVLLWTITGLLFWFPFIYFNIKHYNRWMVSPAGQSLLEGLGELPNKWGHKLNDEYVNELISTKYGLRYGTVAFDEAAMHEFKQCVKEDPGYYIKTLVYRLPDVLLPGLQWIFYEQSPYAGCTGVWQKLCAACSSLRNVVNFCMRHLWMRLYLLCGYVGLILLWKQKRYMTVLLIITLLLSGLSTYPSHIEYRYLVPFYWAMSLAVGYVLLLLK